MASTRGDGEGKLNATKVPLLQSSHCDNSLWHKVEHESSSCTSEMVWQNLPNSRSTYICNRGNAVSWWRLCNVVESHEKSQLVDLGIVKSDVLLFCFNVGKKMNTTISNSMYKWICAVYCLVLQWDFEDADSKACVKENKLSKTSKQVNKIVTFSRMLHTVSL